MEGSETKWINLYPADRNRTKGGDFVTIFGNAWNKESDADVNVEVDASYEDAHVGIMFEEFDQSVLKK